MLFWLCSTKLIFWTSVFYLHIRGMKVRRTDRWRVPLVCSSASRSTVALQLFLHAPPDWRTSPFIHDDRLLKCCSNCNNFFIYINFQCILCEINRFSGMLLDNVSTDGVCLCVCACSERRGGAPFSWLSAPLCSNTAANLLTGTFHYRDGEHAQYIASHTHTRIHIVHTHTWTAYMALHGVLILSQQLLPTTQQHTFHLAVSQQSILL